MSLSWVAVLLICASSLPAQSGKPAPTSLPTRHWTTATATNEVAMLQHSDIYLRYRMHMVDRKGDQVRDVIESKDGTVARLILRDGRPLTTDEDTAERQRLDEMLRSPDAYAKHIKSDVSGKKMAVDLVLQMPDAMSYAYTPGQPQIGRNQGEGEVVLDYHPNPQWTPPSTTAEALTGLEGRMWIDVKSQTLLRMEGHIFKPVNFGWGMLAHIYPGGNLTLEQTNAGAGRWIYTHFSQHVTVRALMVKTLNVDIQIDASHFQVLPGALTYQEAIRQLLATPLPQK